MNQHLLLTYDNTTEDAPEEEPFEHSDDDSDADEAQWRWPEEEPELRRCGRRCRTPLPPVRAEIAYVPPPPPLPTFSSPVCTPRMHTIQ